METHLFDILICWEWLFHQPLSSNVTLIIPTLSALNKIRFTKFKRNLVLNVIYTN